jgi:hypothetical protein
VDARTWEACVPFVLEEYEKRREKQREKERRRRTSRARRRLADEKRWRELQESGEHTWPEMKLNDNHWAVVRGHGVSEEIARAAGLVSIQTPEDRALVGEPISRWSPLPALGLPISELGLPVVRHWLLRPDEPRFSKKTGEKAKYEHPGRTGNPLYVVPSDRERILSSVDPLWITDVSVTVLVIEARVAKPPKETEPARLTRAGR